MNRISRRQVLTAAAASATTLTLGMPLVRAKTRQRVLRFVPESHLKILDPVWTTAYITRDHGYLVYDTLFGTDEKLQVKPQNLSFTAPLFWNVSVQ